MIKTQCNFCGNDLEFYPSQFKKSKNHFCDVKCLGDWRSENKSGKNHYAWKGRVNTQCNYCGKDIKVTFHLFKKNKNHFCDKKCLNKFQGDKIKTTCKYCGNELELLLSQFKKSENHFCDSICSGNWSSENRRNENHLNWQGGKKPYCSKFNEKLKEKIRNNYYRKCAMCGGVEVYKKHSVHHIDYDKAQGCNGQDTLMVPLCPSCHGRTGGKRNREYYEYFLTILEKTRITILEYENKIHYRSLGI